MELFKNKKAENSDLQLLASGYFTSFLLKRDQNMEKLATTSMQPIGD